MSNPANPSNHWPAQTHQKTPDHWPAQTHQKTPDHWPAQTHQKTQAKHAMVQYASSHKKKLVKSNASHMTMVFDPALVTELTDESIMMMAEYHTCLVLFYDSDDMYCDLLVTLVEQVATLAKFELLPVSVGALDACNYMDTVVQFTDRLPTLCLFLGGVPIVYTGLFNIGEIHVWLKAQVYTNCCAVSYMYPPMPTPTPTPMP